MMAARWCDFIDLRLEAAVSPGRPLRWGPLASGEENDSKLNFGRVWGPWDVPPGDPGQNDLWADVSATLVDIQWTGGTTSSDTVFPRWEAAQMRAVLYDPPLKFDPTNSLSPFASRLVPNTPVRVRAGIRPAPGVPAESFVTVFGGYVDTWSPQWTAQPADRYTELTATDATRILSNFDSNALESPVGAGEIASTRINRILDHALWPGDQRNVVPGGVLMRSTDHAQPAWTELLLTGDSDLGFVWVAPDGRVNYLPGEVVRERLADTEPDFFFGCDGYDVIIGATPAFNTDGLRNVVSGSNGNATVTRSDEASVFRYRSSTYGRMDLIMQSSTELNLWVDRVLRMGANPRRTISEIVLDPVRDPESFVPLLIPDALDVWRIDWTPPGDETSHTVTVDVTPGGWVHTVTADTWETVVTTGLLPTIGD